MNVAIVGSAQCSSTLGREALAQVHAAFFGEPGGDVAIGTFLRGGIHHGAVELARVNRWPCSQFHGCKALVDWSPDLALIFWDGRSKGCQAVLSELTNSNVLAFVILLRDRQGPKLLGSNAPHIERVQPLDKRNFVHPKNPDLDVAEWT